MDPVLLAVALAGLGYSLWTMIGSLRHGRVGVDVIAVLALAGAIAVDELLAAAVIAVMLVSGGRPAGAPGPGSAAGTRAAYRPPVQRRLA